MLQIETSCCEGNKRISHFIDPRLDATSRLPVWVFSFRAEQTIAISFAQTRNTDNQNVNSNGTIPWRDIYVARTRRDGRVAVPWLEYPRLNIWAWVAMQSRRVSIHPFRSGFIEWKLRLESRRAKCTRCPTTRGLDTIDGSSDEVDFSRISRSSSITSSLRRYMFLYNLTAN